jgi:hypothetical protein
MAGAGPGPHHRDMRAWSEAEKAELLRRVRNGETYAYIAARLGRTRSACLAEHDRLTGREQARRAAKEAGQHAGKPPRTPPATPGQRTPRLISLGGPEWSRPERWQS